MSSGCSRSSWSVALICCVLALGAGCTWSSRVPRGQPVALPENAPREIVALALCEPKMAQLDCDRGDCNHWYRVDVVQAGELRVHLDLGEPEGRGGLARLLLRPLGRPVLQQQMSNRGEPLDIASTVTPDVYGVLVQGGGARRSYDLLVSVVPPGAPPGSGCPDASVSDHGRGQDEE